MQRREMAPDVDEQPVVVPRRGQQAERRIGESENVKRRQAGTINNEKKLCDARLDGGHGVF